MNRADGAHDPYRTLGVDRTASPDALKAAFRKRAKETHPDRNPGDPTAAGRFNAVHEAYADLMKRASSPEPVPPRHPPAGHGAASDPRRTRPEGRQEDRRTEDWNPFSDAEFWEALQRGRAGAGGRAESSPPRPTRRAAPPGGFVFSIPIETAWAGGDIRCRPGIRAACETCDGTGAQLVMAACGYCGGTRRRQGSTRRSVACGLCRGTGRTGLPTWRRCEGCAGTGSTAREIPGTVRVAPGIQDGEIATFVEDGTGRRLPIVVEIARSRRFERDGDDLIATRSVSRERALKGTTLTVVGVDGRKRRVRVPPGTGPGTALRLVGLGMPRRGGGGSGDMLIRLKMSVPKAR